MHPIRRCLCVLATLLLAPVAAIAGEPPAIGPQWVATFWRDVVASDDLASTFGRTWLRTDDGGAVVVTLGRDPLMRRFAADGTELQSQWLPSWDIFFGIGAIERITLAPHPTAADFYMLVEGHNGVCRLVRSSPQFRPRWSMPVPSSSSDEEPCTDLHVLPDGSVLILRPSTLARLRNDGSVAWTAPGGNAFVVDALDLIWVAGRDGNRAAVSRFDPDGSLLSTDAFLCADCTTSMALAIDALPGGDVIVGGASGYLQPGFLARYDSSGMRRLWIDTEIDVRYSRVAHDLQGSVYVMADEPNAPTTVRRVDGISGQVQWEVQADEFASLPDGIAAIRRSASGVVAAGIGSDGQARWTETLSPDGSAVFSRPLGGAGGVELLVRESDASSTGCGNAPRLLALDGDGTPTASMHACTMPLLRRVLDFDVAHSSDVLVRLQTELVRLDAGGEERWRASTCSPCRGTEADDTWLESVLAPDGGAWALRLPHRLPATANPRMSIERIGADGGIAFALPTERVTSDEPSARVFAMADGAIVITAAPRSLVWRSVGDDGGMHGMREHPMPDDDFDILSAHALADGSVSLIASGEKPCYFGCTPFSLSVLRIAADGEVAWRHDFPDAHWQSGLAPDGTGVLVSAGAGSGDPLLLRRFDADGEFAEPVPLSGLPSSHFALTLAGPASGQWLLRTGGVEPWDLALWSLDDEGHVQGARFDLPEETHGFGEDGFVFSVLHETGPRMHLLDPLTLAPRLQFPHGGGESYSADVLPWRWHQLADGTAYGSWTLRGYTLGLARYALPWGAPQDLLFRSGFN